MTGSPVEVLGIAADLEDGRADQEGTVRFLDRIEGMIDQGQRLLKSVGR
jgi:hypothetical protein